MQRGLLGIQRRFRVGSLLGGGLGFARACSSAAASASSSASTALFLALICRSTVSKGQHLVQAFACANSHSARRRPAAAWPAAARAKASRASYSVRLAVSDVRRLLRQPANINSVWAACGGSHVGDLPRQFRRLPGERGNLVLGLRLGAF